MHHLQGYQIIWDMDTWQAWLRQVLAEARVFSYDFETTPGDNLTADPLRAEQGAKVAGIAMAYRGSDQLLRSCYLPIRHDPHHAGGRQTDHHQAIRCFADFIRMLPADILAVVHNLTMELSIHVNEQLPWFNRHQLQDTMIGARVLNRGVGFEELIGLKPLQEHELKRDMSSKGELDRWLKAHRYKPGEDIWRAPPAIAGFYAQDDARDALCLWERWGEQLWRPATQWWWHRAPDRATRHDLYELELEAAINAVRSCLRGTRLDLNLARRQTTASELLQDISKRWLQSYLGLDTINPGSPTQLRGIIFSEQFAGQPGCKVSLQHMTESFRKLPEAAQNKLVEGGELKLRDFAALDIGACHYYQREYPHHADFFFMLGVFNKCKTVQTWARANVEKFAILGCLDPWWDTELSPAEAQAFAHLIFHRLKTVGTISGRMASSHYNAQQVPKLTKLLFDADWLKRLLEAFLPSNQLAQLWDHLLFQEVDAETAKDAGIRQQEGQPTTAVSFSARSLFITRPGRRMRLWDLSQVEMRGFAHYSANPLLCQGYGKLIPADSVTNELRWIWEAAQDPGMTMERYLALHPQAKPQLVRHWTQNDFDIHKFVAGEVDCSRKDAKGINFGIVYGMGQRKLARQLGWALHVAKQYLGRYYSRFPEIDTLQTTIKETLTKRGYVVDPFGRRYYLPPARAYVGLNRLIQGWAASVCKVGYVRICDLMEQPLFGAGSAHSIFRRPDLANWLLNAIHDELMGEFTEEHDTPFLDYAARSSMTLFHGLRTPLGTSSERSLGSWEEAEDVDYSSYLEAA